jgi:hypothetical protein
MKESNMRTLTGILLVTIGGLLVAATATVAQPPPGRPGGRGPGGAADDADPFVARMMRFDENQDGKLTRNELTEPRLQALFDRADADKDGTVTKDELTALFAREAPGPGPGGPGGPGGFGGGPFGRGMGGPPRPGEVLPMPVQERLGLSEVQKEQVAALQKEVEARLDRILTADQKEQLKEMRNRGPGGFGPPPGGPPPGGPGRGGRGPGPGPGPGRGPGPGPDGPERP